MRIWLRRLSWLWLALSVSALGWASSRASESPRIEADRLVKAQATTKAPGQVRAIELAKSWLERARRMRRVGDTAHAEQAERVALEWARTAHDLGRARQAEADARRATIAARDAGAAVDRKRAAIEERTAEVLRERRALGDAGLTYSPRNADDKTKPKQASKDGGR